MKRGQLFFRKRMRLCSRASFRLCYALLALGVAAALMPFELIAQQKKTVRGHVVDEESHPISGVTVLLKNATYKALTDSAGNYLLKTDGKKGEILVFTAVGYETKELPVPDTESPLLDVVMRKDVKGLGEVVVVGFGQQKKQSVVGAQSTISPRDLKVPMADLTTAIAGRVAGVVATQRGGGPGQDAADLYIRGIGTFTSSPQTPLLVVDGVPDRAINNIDPEDIESFTVLKDATATAVYGTRGANGVILINTKKGKSGKPKINAEGNQAISRFTFLPQFIDAPTFMNLYNEGLQMRGRQPFYSPETINKHISGVDPDLYPNVNWFKALFNEFGSSNRLNLNVNGGSEDASYYISAGYFDEVGQFKRDNVQSFNSSLRFKRFNFNSNVNVNITKSTTLDLGINGFITNYNRPATSVQRIFELATMAAPQVIPIQYSNGQWSQYRGTEQNPYMMLTQSGVANSYNNAIRSNIRVGQNLSSIIDGLRASAMFAFDVNANNNLTRSRQLQTYQATGRGPDGQLITEISTPGSNDLNFALTRFGDRRFYSEASLNYAKRFGKHDVSGLFLVNQSDFSDATARVTSYQAAIPYRQRNYVGRTNYGFLDRYYAEVNFSISGSDNFSPEHRYGFFPSFGVGWVVSQEPWWNRIFSKAIPYFKLRYSHGRSGNATLTNPDLRFLFLDTYEETDGYSFNMVGTQNFNGYRERRIGGDVRWETSLIQNLGIEMNFFNNELRMILELFRERRNGILMPNLTIPYASGFLPSNFPYANIGKTQNKGIDLTLDYNKRWTNGKFFSIRGTFNYNRNLAIFDGLPPWRYPYLNRVGLPISQRFGYIATGLFKTQDEIDNSPLQPGDVRVGDIRYKDLNGDGIINSYDQAPIGYGPVPRIIYGINIGTGYKGFDLSLFFQGAGMVDFSYSSGYATTPFSQGATYGNMYKFVTDRWTPENPSERPFYPRLSTNQDLTSNYLQSTWWVKRADYIRLKQVNIGYTFKKGKLLGLAGISALRVYAVGYNVLTFSSWKFWDPELGDGRGTQYPNITAYNIGLRVNFK